MFRVIYPKPCPSNTKLLLGCKVVCHLRFFLLKWSLCEDSKGKWYKINNCSALVIIFDDILFILQLAKLWNFYCKKLHIMTLFMHGKIIKVAPGFNLKVWKNHRVALLYRNIKIDGERGLVWALIFSQHWISSLLAESNYYSVMCSQLNFRIAFYETWQTYLTKGILI